MSYAITIETGERGIYLVFCAACREDLGTMTMDTIRVAIQVRGPIICPGCRLRKCDFCGVIKRHRLPLTGGPFAAGAYRVCPLCVQMKRNQKLPDFDKVWTMTAQREVALNEVIIEQ